MTDFERVSVIGLGQMGSALARAFIAAGHQVTVWNRSPARAAAFEGTAERAATPATACAASDLIVVSLADYVAARSVLDTPGVADAARGRCLVQLTSGTPGDARAGAAWAAEGGTGYLDGAVMAYPSGIGRPESALVYSGPKDLFDRHAATLSVLGGATAHVGEAIGVAATLDCGLLAAYYAATVGFLYGAALCASEGVALPDFFAGYRDFLPVVAETSTMCEQMIAADQFKGTDCTLHVHAAAARNIARMSRENKVDPHLMETVLLYFERATDQGHGPDEIAAVFDVLGGART